MKKQKLQIISIAAAATMLLQIGVSAFGGTYPVHPEYSGVRGQEYSLKMGWTSTDENYLFTVDGKSFILLDTDDEGNYFVMTEDEYGKHAVDTSYT